jgi:hypothetical protein
MHFVFGVSGGCNGTERGNNVAIHRVEFEINLLNFAGNLSPQNLQAARKQSPHDPKDELGIEC